ncbi:MAG: dipeptidase PepE [Candidatus Kapabacteria bacterium]|nr:dipeptidase PepE [Ignavibacteriota bacterium]MCW5885824.1 dipeptidase PepE [Candidatus Kapabacteria bacterium]
MNLLLLSNSTTQGYTYLEHAFDTIKSYFGNGVKKIAFVPYAGVTINWDEYTKKVADVFSNLGYEIISVHTGDAKEIINSADGIAVGGGNTFNLLKTVYDNDLKDLIKSKVIVGMPYIGWSAGSNLACPTIRTTNDMPIVEPPTFNALNLIPFQINPHYLDAHPDGHHGETREQRLLEFLEANKNMYVVGLREGSSLQFVDNKLSLIGLKQARIFKYGQEIFEVNPGDNLDFLMK